MKFIKNIKKSIEKNTDSNVLFINNEFFQYKEFSNEIKKIKLAIKQEIPIENKLIGLVTNDDIQTYASIIALWLEGKAYVPVNPETPIESLKHEILRCDLLLIMGVHPGKSGQKFLGDSVLEKIKEARAHFPKTTIAVDGGITKKNAKSIIEAGADQLCVSSVIWKEKDKKSIFTI